MADRRKKNSIWYVADESGKTLTWDEAQLAVLMDIRDELQAMNRVLRCPNFQHIPAKLDRIGRNTAKPRKRRK